MPQFDITTQVRILDTVEVPVTHPVTGEPTGIVITLAGPYSAQGKAAQFAILEAFKKKGEASAAEWDAKALDALVTCTVGWSGVTADGEPLPCEEGHARDLYLAAPWLREQVQGAYNERGRFFANGATSS